MQEKFDFPQRVLTMAFQNILLEQPETEIYLLTVNRPSAPMALELLTTARHVKADEAVRIGLANHVYAAAELKEKILCFLSSGF